MQAMTNAENPFGSRSKNAAIDDQWSQIGVCV